MDEDLAIINSNTRNEKIKNFFLNNKKKILIFLIIIFIILISFFVYKEFKNKQMIEISNSYNSVIIDFSKNNNKEIAAKNLIDIIKKKDKTYSPLSLYFIIDNNLIIERKKINELFEILINKTSLDNEIKNLIIYKKALYNADLSSEDELLNILNPLINSKSIWKSHALYLMAEYYFSKNEMQKSKEFFNKTLTVENANQEIIKETQKRLKRDLGE